MKSVMMHDFSRVPQVEIPRSVFNRTHGHKTTFNAGYLIPFYTDEVIPGDSFNVKATIFARMATPIYPLMDNLHMDVHYFYVPLRLIWSNAKFFFGEKVNPTDSTEYFVPQIVAPAAGGWTEMSLSDYFGIPTKVNSLSTASFWHRAYNLIFNEWYRDQNIQNSVTVDLGDGPDTAANYPLLRRGKRHDYFTSALPWPQKGSAVTIPLGTQAPIATDATNGQILSVKAPNIGVGDYHMYVAPDLQINTNSANSHALYADLSGATAATINALRQAFQIQRMYERDARSGTRYKEVVQAHFGVNSPDLRATRPVYLGGSTGRVQVTPIAQTSQTAGAEVLGKLAAIGTIGVHNAGFTASFTEHGVLLGILSVRADLTYQQGLPRMFSRLSKFDFYWPGFAHLGEQTVLNKEIYCDGSANDALPFGYQERFAEYRYFPSKITGQMRSNATTPLDAWHLSQEFGSLPTLSPTFIVENPPMDRVLTVSSPHFIMDSLVEVRSARPMPVYAVPGLIDHF